MRKTSFEAEMQKATVIANTESGLMPTVPMSLQWLLRGIIYEQFCRKLMDVSHRKIHGLHINWNRHSINTCMIVDIILKSQRIEK